MSDCQGERLQERGAGITVGHTPLEPAGWKGWVLSAWEPGLQEQSGVTSLASRVGWAEAAVASKEAGCAVAGLSAGPRARVEGPGSCRPAEPDGHPMATALARCLAHLRLPSLTARFLEWEGCAAEHWLMLDSAWPWGVWASGRPVEAQPVSIIIRIGRWAPADDAWRQEESLKGLSRRPRNDRPWLPLASWLACLLFYSFYWEFYWSAPT